MLATPDTQPIDLPPLASTLSMPYTLTPGRAVGTVLAELAKRRLVGARFRKSGRVVVPAQDFCPVTGESEYDLIEAPPTGTLTAFTETATGTIGMIRIDGSDVDFPHRVIGARFDELAVGVRVAVAWAEGAEGIMAIAGFKLAPNAPIGVVRELTDPAKPLEVVAYRLTLEYRHAFGPFYGRLFDEIRTNRRIMGVRLPGGEEALLPPREIDDLTHRKTGTWVEVKQTGTVRAMSVIHLAIEGQKRQPPYIYAEITLDGAATRLIHTVAGFDMNRAKELVKPGTRVRAVWKETRTGSLDDISHFELIDG